MNVVEVEANPVVEGHVRLRRIGKGRSAGDVLAKIPRETTKTKDVTGTS